jgi:hypothetical protein
MLPVATCPAQRSHCVALPQAWTEGFPVDKDKRDGVLPFSFAVQQSPVSTRQRIKDTFQFGFSRYKLFRAPLIARSRISVLQVFVDQRDARHKIVCSCDAEIDQVATTPVDAKPVRP